MRRSLTRHIAAPVLLGLAMLGPVGAQGSTGPQFTYATMSDGVKIALAVSFPTGFNPSNTYPALFMMDGYAGGASALNTTTYGRNKYVVVHASLRGTGCSGGKFNLFDQRSSLDGKEIIDAWISSQSWSNGRVGIIGHSYPGLTGFLVAATSPRNAYATAVSGLIDDLYRGIVYPGGVPNYGFPAIWTGAYRPASELSGNASRYQSESFSGDPTCMANVASRQPGDPLDNAILNGLNTQDSQWWASHALTTFTRGITAPMHITQQWQDEQTGPRGGHVLWERLPEGLPKRLVLTNGVHSTTGIAQSDRNEWLDCWIIDRATDPNAPCGTDSTGHAIDDPAHRVRIHFETRSGVVNAPLTGSDWPLPNTDWRRYYLRGDATLSTTPGNEYEVNRYYVSSPFGRQTTATAGMGLGGGSIGNLTYAATGPDQVSYTLDFGAPTTIAGPILLSLNASASSPDVDFFVDVLDYNTATGEYQYLQRGMQRASHRAIDPLASDYVKAPNAAAGTMYRAHHPHTNPQPIVPEQLYTFQIEVFPVGHHFRAGHQLVLSIHAPPVADPLSTYAWVSAQPPSQVRIVGRDGASSILLPIVPNPSLGSAPACGAQIGVPCFKPAL